MTKNTLPGSLPIESVRQRLERWRRTRQHRTRIPEVLWAAAVDLARQFGIHKTARALRLDYYSLKKRLEAAGVNEPPAEVATTFVELFRPPASSAAGFRECTVEFDDGCGAKMRMYLKGADTADLVALSRTFWSGKE